MKFVLVFMLVFIPAAVSAAASDNSKTAPTKPAVQMAIPKDAVANSDGTWSYTDKQGKHWTYAKTPFGVSRASASPVKAPAAAGIPKGAVRNPNGTYSWTDKDGKQWVYAVTPFGYSRAAASEVLPADPNPPVPSTWKAVDKGDTVHFERQSLMGTVVWEKKKTELNDQERRVYEAQKSESPK